MVNVSSLCDILIRLKLNLPIFESTILRYTIILKHFSYVDKLSMLSYGLHYPKSNLCRAVIPYSAMRYHYFDNCAHDLRQTILFFEFIQMNCIQIMTSLTTRIKLPLSSDHEPDVEVALIFIFFDPIDDQSLFDL